MNTRNTQRNNLPTPQRLTTMSADNQPTTAIFAPISAPVLRSVDPVRVASFLKERERYELEITAKQTEIPSLKTVPYTASIDRTLLKSLFYMGKFYLVAPNAASANELTDEQLKAYIESLVNRPDSASVDPAVIESALSGLTMPMKIHDADARITTYCADFFERLDSVGCSSFPEDNPKKSIRLLCAHLEPVALKKEMRKRVEFDTSLEKSVKGFIKLLTQEAINCQAYGGGKSNDSGSNGRGGRTDITRQYGDENSTTTAPPTPKGSTKTPKKLTPVCLWPPHKEKGLRHYLKDCRECPKEEKDKLFDKLRAGKKETVRRTNAHGANETQSSVIFSATFAEKVRTTVCADIGADTTIMDAKMLD